MSKITNAVAVRNVKDAYNAIARCANVEEGGRKFVAEQMEKVAASGVKLDQTEVCAAHVAGSLTITMDKAVEIVSGMSRPGTKKTEKPIRTDAQQAAYDRARKFWNYWFEDGKAKKLNSNAAARAEAAVFSKFARALIAADLSDRKLRTIEREIAAVLVKYGVAVSV